MVIYFIGFFTTKKKWWFNYSDVSASCSWHFFEVLTCFNQHKSAHLMIIHHHRRSLWFAFERPGIKIYHGCGHLKHGNRCVFTNQKWGLKHVETQNKTRNAKTLGCNKTSLLPTLGCVKNYWWYCDTVSFGMLLRFPISRVNPRVGWKFDWSYKKEHITSKKTSYYNVVSGYDIMWFLVYYDTLHHIAWIMWFLGPMGHSSGWKTWGTKGVDESQDGRPDPAGPAVRICGENGDMSWVFFSVWSDIWTWFFDVFWCDHQHTIGMLDSARCVMWIFLQPKLIPQLGYGF